MNEKYSRRPNLFLLLRMAVLACALLFPILGSFGFCFQPNPTVTCEFLNSDAAFVGKVVSVHDVPPRDKEYDGWLYSLTVQELFRGPKTKTIKVFTENSSARFPLEVGKQYLLFAKRFNGRLGITSCGNSALLSAAQLALAELRRFKTPRDAVIEGRISFSGIPDTGTHIPGIQVTFHSGVRTFRVASDQNGWFHLHVPPAEYSAEIEQIPHWSITPYDLSRDNPAKFEARPGRCFALQFVASSN